MKRDDIFCDKNKHWLRICLVSGRTPFEDIFKSHQSDRLCDGTVKGNKL